MKFNKKDLLLLPNILTYVRLLCVPFFVWVILDTRIPSHEYIAFGLFMFASFTDVVDGFIARQFNLTSDIGKVLDPLADKLLQVSTLLGLTLIGKIHWIFPLIFFIKESYLVMGGGFIINAMKSDYVLQSNFFGKGATWLTSLGIVLAFFVGDVNVAYDISVIIVLSIGAGFSIITAIIYTKQFVKFRKDELASGKGITTRNRIRALISKEPQIGECGELRDELCGKCSECDMAIKPSGDDVSDCEAGGCAECNHADCDCDNSACTDTDSSDTAKPTDVEVK